VKEKLTGALHNEQNPQFQAGLYSAKTAKNGQNPLKKFFP
jgi:hypothetical protein